MKTTAKEWERVRTAFASSLMVDTPLRSLAQNLDGHDWPAHDDEKPSAYIDLSLGEATLLLAERGHEPGRIDVLAEILRETLAFDAPFGEMVQQTAAAEEKDDPFRKNLLWLGIPEDFPILLTTLDADTRAFCWSEKITTLGELTAFAQRMAQAVIVGGDFRKLLNAIATTDESALAELLPFRRGSKGLHLAEALAQAGRASDATARVDRAMAWFSAEAAVFKLALADGEGLARHLAVLDDRELEARSEQLIRTHLAKTRGVSPKRAGWWKMVTRWFAKKPAYAG